MDGSSLYEKEQLAFEAEVQKRLVSSCVSKVHKYINSRTWEIFANKFRSLNVNLPRNLVECRICEEPLSGHYFEQQKKIVICANNVIDNEFDYTITHELVHIYDHARAELDFSDPGHVACSEIRATNLSAECRPAKYYRWMNRNSQYIECVKGRAVDSLHFNFKGLTREAAGNAVNSVWEVCYYDYEPFSFDELRKKLSGKSF